MRGSKFALLAGCVLALFPTATALNGVLDQANYTACHGAPESCTVLYEARPHARDAAQRVSR